MLMKLVQSGKIAGELFGTHEFALNDMLSAYDTFADAGANNALKMVIRG
jgi:alcohol dehydrogenase